MGFVNVYKSLTSLVVREKVDFNTFEELVDVLDKLAYHVPLARWDAILQGYDLAEFKHSPLIIIGKVDEANVRVALNREHLIIDLDESAVDVPSLNIPYQHIYYNTARHIEECARQRVLIKCSRVMSPDEFRHVTKVFISEYPQATIDPTCDQPNRMMYAPVCFAGEKVIMVEGSILDVDEYLLKSGVTGREKSTAIFDRIKGKKDPRDGETLVAAFCRVYSIHDTIAKFMPKLYVDRAGDRYRWHESTSVGGAVVYNDTWMYSQHKKDPVCGKHLNAWELCLHHLFGGDTAKTYTFTRKDEAVTAEYNKMLALSLAEGDREAALWLGRLLRHSKTNELLPTYANFALIIENDEELKRAFKYDALANRQYIDKSPIWREDDASGQSWTGADDASLILYIEKKYGKASEKHIRLALAARILQVSYNPLIDFFNSIPAWDGVPRVSTMFTDYLGVEDTPLVRRMARMFMTACYTRAYTTSPANAVIWHIVPVLYSQTQGVGKSKFCSMLGGDFFLDGLRELSGDKETIMNISGKLIVELDEMEAVFSSKASVEAARGFITRKVDSVRIPYVDHYVDKPRIASFIGTTNSRTFLTDPSGSRRFFPLHCAEDINFERLEKMDKMPVKQMWAEVKETMYGIEPLYFNLFEMEEQKELSDRYSEEYAFVPQIVAWLDELVPLDWKKRTPQQRISYWDNRQVNGSPATEQLGTRANVSLNEIWYECLRLPINSRRRGERDAVERALQNAGWVISLDRVATVYGKIYVWENPKHLTFDDL